MYTAVPDPAPPPPARGRLTLLDWVNAQRALVEEEERLQLLVARPRLHQEGPAAVERQRMRVQVAQDAADAIYDAVMKDMRSPW